MTLTAGEYTDLFEVIGEYVQRINDFETIISDLTTDVGQIKTEITGNSYPVELYSDLETQFDRFQENVISWINTLVDRVRTLLQNDTVVLSKFTTTSGWEGVLTELYRDMEATSQSILRNTVTIGAVSSDTTNSDVATVVTGKVLDGYNAALTGGQIHEYQSGEDSELAPTADTLVITCVSDSTLAGISDGAESWELGGLDGKVGYVIDDLGSGRGPNMQCLSQLTRSYGFSNFDFETWTDASTLGTWTKVGAGDPTRDGADQYKGTYGASFAGDGATNWEFSQTPSGLDRYRRYCLACYVKGEAGIAAGDLEILFEGTGYTAGVTEKITMDAAALAAQTSYGVEYFFVTMPSEIPDDLKLSVKISNNLTNAKTVRIDHMQFGPVDYFAGVHMSIIDGAGKSLKNDKFTFTLANDDAGLFQTFFRKGMKLQLPSAAVPSIADALASD